MKIIIYIRSSDASDQVDDRLTILTNTSADRGWTVEGVHVDRLIGPSKGRNRLPGLAATLNAIARQEVDAVAVWSIHHLGTSVDGLLDTLAELHRNGVKLIVHDHDNDAETVENGGLLPVADLLVDARRALPSRSDHRRPTESQGLRYSVWPTSFGTGQDREGSIGAARRARSSSSGSQQWDQSGEGVENSSGDDECWIDGLSRRR